MAHRKPLGTTCRSTLDWRGGKPNVNDALVSSAGTWYRIVGVEEKRNPDKVGVVLERVARPDRVMLASVTAVGRALWPDDTWGIIHEFEWYSRNRKRAG